MEGGIFENPTDDSVRREPGRCGAVALCMKTLKSRIEKGAKLTVARTVFPEDLAVGDSVVLSQVAFQYPSFCWCGADMTVRPPEEPIQIAFQPSWDKHEPMKVKAVCLPFVLCKTVEKKHCVLDLRQVKVAKVDSSFAAAVKTAKTSDLKPTKAKKSKRKDPKTKSRKKKSRKKKK